MHFSESGIVRMIQEYAAEYDALEMESFFKKTEFGSIIGVNGMDMFYVNFHSWANGELWFNTRYGSFGSVKCEPNNVVHYLNEFAAKDVRNYVGDELPMCEVINILAAIKVITFNLQRRLVPKCHMVEETYAPHLSSDY